MGHCFRGPLHFRLKMAKAQGAAQKVTDDSFLAELQAFCDGCKPHHGEKKVVLSIVAITIVWKIRGDTGLGYILWMQDPI